MVRVETWILLYQVTLSYLSVLLSVCVCLDVELLPLTSLNPFTNLTLTTITRVTHLTKCFLMTNLIAIMLLCGIEYSKLWLHELNLS
jgi:hypothetical protein